MLRALPVACLLVGCLSVVGGCVGGGAAAVPELGARVRCRIAGRGDVPSITSADHRVFVVLQERDGRRLPVRVFSPKYASSEGLLGAIGVRAASLLQRERPTWSESLHGDPELVHDMLFEGVDLCFEPGSFYVYRHDGETGRFVADPDPEIRLGQLRADGSGYEELTPSLGPAIDYDDDPAGWPAR